MKSFTVDKKEFYEHGKLLKICGLVNAWYESVDNPEEIVACLKKYHKKKHVFTFFQRPPHSEPKFNYFMESYSIAVIKLTSYENWWNKDIRKYARQAVKRSQKYGVEVRKAEFNDELIYGISNIFNESPIRLGKKFPHFKKSVDRVRREVGTFLEKSIFLGAYCKNELVGYVKIVFEDEFADILNLLSKISHREKCITNALLAKTIEVCCERKIGYIAYGDFDSSSLSDFKRHNGFVRMDLPRYYVPLNYIGEIAIKLRLHRRLSQIMPNWVQKNFRLLRKKWYDLKIPYRSSY